MLHVVNVSNQTDGSIGIERTTYLGGDLRKPTSFLEVPSIGSKGRHLDPGGECGYAPVSNLDRNVVNISITCFKEHRYEIYKTGREIVVFDGIKWHEVSLHAAANDTEFSLGGCCVLAIKVENTLKALVPMKALSSPSLPPYEYQQKHPEVMPDRTITLTLSKA